MSLSGTVPSLWAKTKAIAEARELEDVTMIVSDALEIKRAESDRAIVKQIGKRIRRSSLRPVVFYGIFDSVSGWIDDGVVTPTGYVTHEYKAGRQFAAMNGRVGMTTPPGAEASRDGRGAGRPVSGPVLRSHPPDLPPGEADDVGHGQVLCRSDPGRDLQRSRASY